MNKAFEEILERLEELQNNLLSQTEGDINLQVGVINGVMYSKKIVQEVAEEYTSTEHINCSTNTSTDTSTNGWIPCSERLPKNNKEVLCYAKSTARGGDVMFVGSQDNGCWFLPTAANTLSYPNQYIVKAWQPLPQPYKESE